MVSFVTWLAAYGSLKHHSVIHSRGLSRRTWSIIKESMESMRTHKSSNKGKESIGEERKQQIELIEVSCFLLLDLSLLFLLCVFPHSLLHISATGLVVQSPGEGFPLGGPLGQIWGEGAVKFRSTSYLTSQLHTFM